MHIGVWFAGRADQLRLEPLSELRMRVGLSRVRIPDVVVDEIPLRDEEVFTSPPYLCIEVDGIMRTADGRVAMPLAEVLLP